MVLNARWFFKRNKKTLSSATAILADLFWFYFLDICIFFSVFSKFRGHISSIYQSIRSLAGDRWNVLLIVAYMCGFFFALCDMYIFYEPWEARNRGVPLDPRMPHFMIERITPLSPWRQTALMDAFLVWRFISPTHRWLDKCLVSNTLFFQKKICNLIKCH